MNNKYIVRADFYPNGDIVPLGITDDVGNSVYIKKIVKVERENNKNGYVLTYYCICSAGDYILKYGNNEWYCSKR